MIKYSIIIPVYNCSKYIEQCINSIANQKFSDYEIIIVDDCSKDDTLAVCEKMQKENGKVVVLSQETNQGVSMARNRGIEEAKGKYILFVDGDDYVSDDYFEKIESNLNNDSLLTFFNYDCVCKKGEKEEIEKGEIFKRFEENDYQVDSFHDFLIKTFFASPCNKVYRSDIIKKNNIRFDKECVCYEDLLFNFEYIKYIEKVNIIKEQLYYYRLKKGEKTVLKRKWGEPFLISKKVAEKANELSKMETFKDEKSTLNLYVYTAFFSELRYLKLAKKGYRKYLDMVIHEEHFRNMIFSLQNSGKKISLLQKFLKENKNFLAKILIGVML